MVTRTLGTLAKACEVEQAALHHTAVLKRRCLLSVPSSLTAIHLPGLTRQEQCLLVDVAPPSTIQDGTC